MKNNALNNNNSNYAILREFLTLECPLVREKLIIYFRKLVVFLSSYKLPQKFKLVSRYPWFGVYESVIVQSKLRKFLFISYYHPFCMIRDLRNLFFN